MEVPVYKHSLYFWWKVFKIFHCFVIVQVIDGYVLVIQSLGNAETSEVGPPSHGSLWSTCSLFISALLSPEMEPADRVPPLKPGLTL